MNIYDAPSLVYLYTRATGDELCLGRKGNTLAGPWKCQHLPFQQPHPTERQTPLFPA